MKIKNILKIGLTGLLSLYMAGCTKPNFRNIEPLHNINEAEEENKGDIMPPEGCEFIYKKTIRLKNKNIDVLVLAESYRCDKPENLVEGNKYITNIKEYYVISNGLKNGELNEDENVCVEYYPYITMIRLDNEEKIYFIDEGRNGEYDVVLKTKLDMNLDKALDLIGLPNPAGSKCYERSIVRR